MPTLPRLVRIGAPISQYGATWPDLVAAAREIEAIGTDALFTWDHFFGPKDSDVPEL